MPKRSLRNVLKTRACFIAAHVRLSSRKWIAVDGEASVTGIRAAGFG